MQCAPPLDTHGSVNSLITSTSYSNRQTFRRDVPAQAKKKPTSQRTDREYWSALAYKMAQPVLENMAKGELQKNMKTEFSPSFDNRDRSVVYMETFGRLMAGIAPWLTLPDDDSAEGQQRKNFVNGHWLPTGTQ